MCLYRQGGKPGSVSVCRECEGQGRVIKVRQLGPGFVQQFQTECSACNGQGQSFLLAAILMTEEPNSRNVLFN